MLFPVVKSSELVALQTLFAFAQQASERAALALAVKNQRDTFAHLLRGQRRGPFFFPVALP